MSVHTRAIRTPAADRGPRAPVEAGPSALALAAAVAASPEAARVLLDSLCPPQEVRGRWVRRFIARRLCGLPQDGPDSVISASPGFAAATPADDAGALRVAVGFARRSAWGDLGRMLAWASGRWRSGRLSPHDWGELDAAAVRAGFDLGECRRLSPAPGDALAGWRDVVAQDAAEAVEVVLARARAARGGPND